MKHPKSSSDLNKEYACFYSNIREVNKKTVCGFKLVVDKVENFYSIGTGMYRYKTGFVKRVGSDYSQVYLNNPEYYCEEMIDKVAIFKTLDDLTSFYPDWKDDKNVAVLEFCISGDIIELEAENKYTTVDVYAGTIIQSLKRV